MAKHVLLLFSYDVYPGSEISPYIEHATILNNLQQDTSEILFHFGALSELTYSYSGSTLTIYEPRSNQDLSNFDMVFFQKWIFLPQHAYAAALYLQQKDVPFISSEILSQNPVSKLGEMMLLVAHDVRYPNTIVGWIENIRQHLIQNSAPFDYPFILKDISGSQGNRNYLVPDQQELDRLETIHHRETFMAQEYHANDGDYRITIIGDEVTYVMHRISREGTHLNNTSQGARGEFIEVADAAPALLKTALQAARAVGRQDFAGVDIISTNDDNYWVLEVNKSPEIQLGYGVDYKSRKLIDYFKRRLL